ncbi:MAG: 3-keto-5-aminohexanoate cleavage protein [Desulfobacterales bacterium]|jgi:3-keto-5-aminohexanoate cleavage enzyme|nr:3-keto-5-aminohexanoate cleavage protein [Desulfobacterales bacterium]
MAAAIPRKVIVAVAPVGRSVVPPAVNPLTPRQVADEAVRCARAGAAMVHLHVRDAKGVQTEAIGAYAATLERIRAASDIIIQGSTGGLTTLSLEERCVALNDPRTEVASLNMGSVNFGEEVYINRLPDIRYWAERMRRTKTMPEMEIFDSGMLPAARALIAEGAIKPPYSVCFCLGFRWTLAPDPKSLFFMTSLMKETVPWGVIHDGMTDFTLLATAIGLGASLVRVGFEDSCFWAPGQRATRNVELVRKLAQLVRLLGHEVATPAEARRILGIG